MKKAFLIKSFVGIFVMLFLVAAVSAVAPTITANITKPDIVYTNTDWLLNITATDNENATFTTYTQFYINGSESGSELSFIISNNTNTNVANLSSSSFGKGASLIAEFWAGDGTDTTAKVNTSATVQNSIPIISSGTITVDSHEDADTATISASDADGDSLTYSVTAVGDPTLASCSISGTTLTAARVNDTRTGTTTCTVTVNDGTATASADFTININRKSMLEIYDLDVYVDNSKDSNLNDGDTISKKAKPRSNIKFDFVIRNLFDEDEEDIEIEDITIYVKIKKIDDGDDLEEETKEFDLEAEEKSPIKSVEFDIPLSVAKGSYDVEIVVEGEEAKSPYTKHRVEWKITLEIEKEKHNMRLDKAEFDRTTLSCDRETTFFVKLVNLGSSDEDELILTIENSALGINIKQEDIEIDEGDDWSRSYTITISDDVAPGTYKVITKMYYDSSDYYDKEFELNAYGSTDLIIKKCEVTAPVKEEKEPEEEEGEIIITPEEGEEKKETIPGEITREVSFQDTSLYLVLLVATVVILAGIFLAMIFRLFPRR